MAWRWHLHAYRSGQHHWFKIDSWPASPSVFIDGLSQTASHKCKFEIGGTSILEPVNAAGKSFVHFLLILINTTTLLTDVCHVYCCIIHVLWVIQFNKYKNAATSEHKTPEPKRQRRNARTWVWYLLSGLVKRRPIGEMQPKVSFSGIWLVLTKADFWEYYPLQETSRIYVMQCILLLWVPVWYLDWLWWVWGEERSDNHNQATAN